MDQLTFLAAQREARREANRMRERATEHPTPTLIVWIEAPIVGGTVMKTKFSTEQNAGRKIKIEAIRTFESAECIYDLAPGEDGRWYLICEMIDPPTWILSWPSLETARRFLDSMSAEDCTQMERVILDVVEKTGQLIATDCGESNTVTGFLEDLDAVAARALNRGRLQ